MSEGITPYLNNNSKVLKQDQFITINCVFFTFSFKYFPSIILKCLHTKNKPPKP